MDSRKVGIRLVDVLFLNQVKFESVGLTLDMTFNKVVLLLFVEILELFSDLVQVRRSRLSSEELD